MSNQLPERRLSVIGEPQIPAVPPQILWGPPPSPPEPEPSVVSNNNANQFGHYLWLLRRHRWRITGFVAMMTIATWTITKRITPVYEATATVDIDRHIPIGVVGPESSRSQSNDVDQYLATQLRIVQSDSVLRPVANRFGLLRHEGQAGTSLDAPVALKNLRVTRPPNTYLMLLTYRSPDPKLASQVANAIASSFLEHTYSTRIKASENLTAFMEHQLVELRAKMERSSDALVRFEQELNLINPEEKINIQSARLLQLNTEFTQAQADRVRKQAALDSINSGTLDSIQVSSQGEALKRQYERMNEVREKLAEASAHYGASHPENRKLASALKELERQIEGTRRNIASRIEAEFKESVGREQMLAIAVRQTKEEFDRINSRSFQYQSIKREADADKKLYEELVRKIKEAGINAGFQSSAVRLADPARPPDKPVSPSLPLNLTVSFLASLILAVSVAVAADMLDNTVREPEDGAKVLGQDVVASLPLLRGRKQLLAGSPSLSQSVALTTDQRSLEPGGFAESIRTLRNSILLADLDRRYRSLLITSASPSEGKSTTAAHLALAHAEHGKRTLLIDADLRRPSVHRRFQVDGALGLTDVLVGQVPWRDAVRPSGFEELSILPAGHPSRRASDLIGRGLYEILDEAIRDYDLVVLDAPPLLGFSESLQMASSVDGVLVVVRAGQTSRTAVRAVLTSLNRLRAHIVGVVLNGVHADMGESYRYYSHYAKYYQAHHSTN